MRRVLVSLLLSAFCFSPLAGAQTASATQTARQALVEMFFGTSANHLEKHLPDVTRNALKKMTTANGMSALDQFSLFATMARASGAKFETFDTGPTLLRTEDPRNDEIVEITVESDNLSGDEDQIQVSLHVTKNGKEQTIPFFPQFPLFTFIMKSESDVWRLNEISVTIRVQLANPDFLKSIQEESSKQQEREAQTSLQTIINAENSYHSAHGSFACSLSELSKATTTVTNGGSSTKINLLSSDLAAGTSMGYVFAISGCDGTQYKVAAEPQVPDSGERAFCSDESGTVRESSDGKATTCVRTGQPVQPEAGATATGLAAMDVAPGSGAAASIPPATAPNQAQNGGSGSGSNRIHLSQHVVQGMALTKVPPVYPEEARAARVQGTVVLAAVIAKDGHVSDLRVISGDPLLEGAAVDAVRQWKYRPYLINGKPVEFDTQITVNFTLANTPPQ
jgi:TonB family protein